MDQKVGQVGHRLDTGWTQVGHRLDTGWTQVGHRLDTGWTQVGHRLDGAHKWIDPGALFGQEVVKR